MTKSIKTQLKSPEGYGRMIDKYGPGFVALSIKSGRVVASAENMKDLWGKIKDKKSFKDNKLIIEHVPPPHTLLVY